MTTDLDRLHAVVSGELRGRGVGKTLAQCHDVASAIELGETDIRAAVVELHDVSHVRPMLEKVLQERGHQVEVVAQRELLVNGRHQVKFIPAVQARAPAPSTSATVWFNRHEYEADPPPAAYRMRDAAKTLKRTKVTSQRDLIEDKIAEAWFERGDPELKSQNARRILWAVLSDEEER